MCQLSGHMGCCWNKRSATLTFLPFPNLQWYMRYSWHICKHGFWTFDPSESHRFYIPRGKCANLVVIWDAVGINALQLWLFSPFPIFNGTCGEKYCTDTRLSVWACNATASILVSLIRSLQVENQKNHEFVDLYTYIYRKEKLFCINSLYSVKKHWRKQLIQTNSL